MEVYKIRPNLLSILELQQMADRVDAFVTMSEDTQLTAVNGLLYSKDMTTLYAVPKNMNGTLILPEQTKIIGTGAFNGVQISTVVGSGVVEIYNKAFANAHVKECYFPSLTIVHQSAFIYSALEFLSAENLTRIGKRAFSNTKLTALRLTKSMTIVGARAFQECRSLRDINVDNGTNCEFKTNVFANCSALESFIFADGKLAWDIGTFQNCYRLKMVTLPTVERIPADTFKGCSYLKSIRLQSQPCEIADETARKFIPTGDI